MNKLVRVRSRTLAALTRLAAGTAICAEVLAGAAAARGRAASLCTPRPANFDAPCDVFHRVCVTSPRLRSFEPAGAPGGQHRAMMLRRYRSEDLHRSEDRGPSPAVSAPDSPSSPNTSERSSPLSKLRSTPSPRSGAGRHTLALRRHRSVDVGSTGGTTQSPSSAGGRSILRVRARLRRHQSEDGAAVSPQRESVADPTTWIYRAPARRAGRRPASASSSGSGAQKLKSLQELALPIHRQVQQRDREQREQQQEAAELRRLNAQARRADEQRRARIRRKRVRAEQRQRKRYGRERETYACMFEEVCTRQAAERREQEMVITLREERATEQRCLDSGIVAPSTLNESQRSYLRGVASTAASSDWKRARLLLVGVPTQSRESQNER